MTPDELLKHPEYHHTIWDLKPERKGKVAVAKDRGGPLNIAYEVHGRGPRHMVVSTSYSMHLLIPKFRPSLPPPSPKKAHTKAEFVMPHKVPQQF